MDGVRMGDRRWAAVATVAACLLAACALLLLPAALRSVEGLGTWPHGTVELGRTRVDVTVADTDAHRSFGLQGRSSLAAGTGMVFVYDTPSQVTFARKTVPFPLDVVFVAPDARVTGVSPLGPRHELAASPGPVGWVVELPGGYARSHRIGVGTPFTPPR